MRYNGSFAGPDASAVLVVVFHHEGHPKVDRVLGDLALVVADDLVVLNLGALDVAKGLAGPRDALAHGVIKAGGRGGGDFGDSCNTHWSSSFFDGD